MLLVEDEQKLATAIARQIERARCEVTLAYDGETALESVTTEEIHLAILDIDLPGISGMDVLQQLRARSYDIRILL